jgi:glycosyltransferase involved in cell wall biosynthesis
MVSYNSAKFIQIAIDSVLGQTHENIELIIGDDNSTDDTWKIITSFNDSRIKAYQNEVNLGEYPNREKIVKQARGSYFIFIDADDILYPHGLEHMVKYLEAFPESAMALSQMPKKSIIYPCELSPKQILSYDYLSNSYINHHGFPYTFFRTIVLKKFWNIPDWLLAGDTYIKTSISVKHKVLLIPDGLAWWRETPGQASGKLQFEMRGRLETLFIANMVLNVWDCPLSETEKEQVRINLVGGFIRQLIFKYFFKGKLSTFIKITKAAKLNFSDFKYFFIKPKYKKITDSEIINPYTDFYLNPFLKSKSV